MTGRSRARLLEFSEGGGSDFLIDKKNSRYQFLRNVCELECSQPSKCAYKFYESKLSNGDMIVYVGRPRKNHSYDDHLKYRDRYAAQDREYALCCARLSHPASCPLPFLLMYLGMYAVGALMSQCKIYLPR